ncbi:MAG: diphthine--ammonia ligase [Methanomassiliicoccales archaeon]|nr:diphthine--ammonia ligase [Methanomassiliicoccales archaeon]
MNLASLFSGGKDSTFAMYLMEQQGHTVDYLVSIIPSNPDSWLFHTPNLHLLPLQARAMEKSLVSIESDGTEEGDLFAMKEILSDLEVDGVVTGAIASDYQWDRINGVCEDLGIRVFSPLWRKDEVMVLREEINAGIRSIIVSVSAEGLESSYLGKEISNDLANSLLALRNRYGVNVSGEGGEYETFVIDSPLHRASIKLLDVTTEISRDQSRLIIRKAILEKG